MNKNGDWFDLVNPDRVPVFQGTPRTINFGIAMQLPKGFEAHVLPRSSTYKNYGLLLVNSMGIIDNTYCGDNDVWRGMFLPSYDNAVPAQVRLLQFKIVPSQRATIWQKLRWLFDSKIKFEEVSSLGNKDRGGFGEGTGK